MTDLFSAPFSSAKLLSDRLLSIVIPLAPDENQWLHLCENFNLLPSGTQVIVVSTPGHEISNDMFCIQKQYPDLHWLVSCSKVGRAVQLNAGAALATGDFIWFLHADSRITQENVDKLVKHLNAANSELCLFYFDLRFYDKQSPLLKMNELGAKFRSDILGLPFGDQGFCLSQSSFKALGGYDEQALFGEDHLLVWQAKYAGIALVNCHCFLATSARKYQLTGWLKLTVKYQLLWPKQAFGQWLKLVKNKLVRSLFSK
ncbi:MAG: glycosyltransferase [Alteromonadaceae bacterium]|nr:glycosyltransferase [Alteromonadaceae bacterium]